MAGTEVCDGERLEVATMVIVVTGLCGESSWVFLRGHIFGCLVAVDIVAMQRARLRGKKTKKVAAPVLTQEEREAALKKQREEEAKVRRQRYVDHTQTKQLGLIKRWWHGSLLSRTLHEEVLGVDPLTASNARQSLGLDVYAAKAIASNLNVVTVEDLYDKFVEYIESGTSAQNTFVLILEKATCSKHKAKRLLELLDLIREKEFQNMFVRPGADESPEVQAFIDFKINTAKRAKEQREKRAAATARKLLTRKNVKNKVRRVSKLVGKVSSRLNSHLEHSRKKLQEAEFDHNEAGDLGTLDEILKPTAVIQARAKNDGLNFSNYEAKLFNMAQVHRPKTNPPKMNRLKALKPSWATAGTMSTSSLREFSPPTDSYAGVLNPKAPLTQSMPVVRVSTPSDPPLCATLPASSCPARTAEDMSVNDDGNQFLSPGAWPARDKPSLGSAPVFRMVRRPAKSSVPTEKEEEDDYVKWYLENDPDNNPAIPDTVDQDLYNLASFQRLTNEEKALEVKRKPLARPLSSGDGYLGGYVSQGQRYSVLRTVVSASNSNKVGLSYLQTCQELKLPLPEAMVRLMSRQSERPPKSPEKMRPNVYHSSHENKASSFIPFNVDLTKANTVINLSRMSLSDKFAEALSSSMSKADGKTVLMAYENRIQGEGAALLLSSREWKYADFHQNNIGMSSQEGMSRFVKAVALPTSAALVDVNLAHNKIKDRHVKLLATALINCKHLSRLELGHNEICDRGAIALGEALLINRSVEELGLGWNRVGRQGAAAFAAGLVINEGITSLDLTGWPYGCQTTFGVLPTTRDGNKPRNGQTQSKNPPPLKSSSPGLRQAKAKKTVNVQTIKEDLRIAKDAPRPGDHVDLQPYKHLLAVEVLGQVFKNNARLTHLDLSYCNLEGERVLGTLADGLQDNHTLLGLHLRGNAMRIDCRGFLHLGAASTPHTLNIGGLTDARGRASELSADRLDFDDSCWICDGWSEQLFYADKADRKRRASPGEEDDPPPLLLSLSFERWNSFPLRMEHDEPEEQRNQKISRMVPPHPFRHYIRAGTKDEQYRGILGNTCVKPTTDDWKKKKVHFHIPKRLEGGLVIHGETALPRILLPNGKLKTDKYVEEKKRPPPPPPEDPMKWLRKDWPKTKLRKWVNDDAELDLMLDVLAPHALLLREVYQYYAFQGTGGSAFTISRNEITQMVREMGIIDKRNMRNFLQIWT